MSARIIFGCYDDFFNTVFPFCLVMMMMMMMKMEGDSGPRSGMLLSACLPCGDFLSLSTVSIFL